MISNLSEPASAPVVPSQTDPSEAGLQAHTPCGTPSTPDLAPAPRPALTAPITPIDVAHTLATRAPVPHFSAEPALLASLPDAIRADLRRLLGATAGGGAFGEARALVKAGHSVSAAIRTVRTGYGLHGSLQRLRARYDVWTKTGDWVSLVNRAKAGGPWQARQDGLPREFLEFVAKRLAAFRRADGKRQAIASIRRQWLTGRDHTGQRAPIPGYGYRPEHVGTCPPGWTYGNLLAVIKAAGLFTAPVRAFLQTGTAAAAHEVPQVKRDRNTSGADGGPMRFLELVEFDDVKTDFLVVDPASGQVVDLWLLVARDYGTAIMLGYGMRPARSRDDGTQEHLRLQDMKQICGLVLERWGLPPYICTWKIERGTATLSEGSRSMLRELLAGQVNVSFSSMLGGKSALGFRQRAIGNSRAKASLESHNRLMHTMACALPGQTGQRYDVRPQDLAGQQREAAETLALVQLLPAELRGQAQFTLLTLEQAREQLDRIFALQNQRTDHELQGFATLAEWWDGTLWRPQTTYPGNGAVRTRLESPEERCARLVAPHLAGWRQVSPDVIRAFYEHSARDVRVQDNGLIEFRLGGDRVEFAPPPGAAPLVPGTRALAYHHPDEPGLIYLTDGQGRWLGTWLRRHRTGDRASLEAALRTQQHALRVAREHAAGLVADERERIEAVRRSNAELLGPFQPIERVRTPGPTRSLASTVATTLTRRERAVKAAGAVMAQLGAEFDDV